jgi:hypothetical protein
MQQQQSNMVKPQKVGGKKVVGTTKYSSMEGFTAPKKPTKQPGKKTVQPKKAAPLKKSVKKATKAPSYAAVQKSIKKTMGY